MVWFVFSISSKTAEKRRDKKDRRVELLLKVRPLPYYFISSLLWPTSCSHANMCRTVVLVFLCPFDDVTAVCFVILLCYNDVAWT
jgi:hypothetical protein